MKKLFGIVSGALLFTLIANISFSYAEPLLTQGKALKLAEQYIENSLSDEAWMDNNPHISAQTPFHVDDSKVVSYIEYKVSCDSTPDCGFILVNVDKNDVAVPIASPTGNTPSELLNTGEGESDYYYFSPFDIYAENLETGFVQALDPGKSIDPREESELKLSKEEKETLKQQKQALKDELKAAKQEAKEYKKSQDFKDRKLEIQDQIFAVPKEEFSMKVLPMANAASYTSPGSSDRFIGGGNYTTGCNGKTPCYKQFSKFLWGCPSGCTPTAMGIIFGWYDRNGYPALLPGTAARTNNTDINNMISSIRNYMGTYCSGGEGSTNEYNVYKGIIYAVDMGYTNAYSQTYTNIGSSSAYSKIVQEVNNNRPLILHITNSSQGQGHSIVAFGYKSTGVQLIIRVNMGWGGSDMYGTYFTSNVDQNIGSIYYKTGYTHSAYGVNTVRMN